MSVFNVPKLHRGDKILVKMAGRFRLGEVRSLGRRRFGYRVRILGFVGGGRMLFHEHGIEWALPDTSEARGLLSAEALSR
jgi:hypothetical protein